MGDIQSTPDPNYVKQRGINSQPQQDWNPNQSHMIDFSARGASYGKPPEGSLTEARAIKARKKINEEITMLLCIMRGIGKRDNSGTICVTFGRIFEFYEPISNKIVGLLLRARRWQLIDFPGEMLYQRRDESVSIRLTIPEEDIPMTNRFDFEDSPKPLCKAKAAEGVRTADEVPGTKHVTESPGSSLTEEPSAKVPVTEELDMEPPTTGATSVETDEIAAENLATEVPALNEPTSEQAVTEEPTTVGAVTDTPTMNEPAPGFAAEEAVTGAPPTDVPAASEAPPITAEATSEEKATDEPEEWIAEEAVGLTEELNDFSITELEDERTSDSELERPGSA